MKRYTLTAAAILAVLPALSLPALAQHEQHGAAPAIDLPAICLENAGDATAMPMEHAMAGDEAHVALMAGMDRMNTEMMAGGTATDLDVAFVCSMIPHHRGAIDMARAELDHGDDPWVRALAQQVVDAQEQEIADMLAWLEKQAAE